MLFIKSLFWFLKSMLLPKALLVIENISLRQQLGVALRSNKRPKLTKQDRIFMVIISKLHSHWQSFLALVQPATVLRWHRWIFKLYWKFKSKPGRPKISPEMQARIRQLSKENPLWSADRIRDTLLLLGFPYLSDNTVRKYMIKPKRPNNPSGTWLTFLRNHCPDSWAIDFFTTYTLNFRMLYCFVVLDHSRRKVVHFAVTANPSMQWIIQQIREATPFGIKPKYLFRDNDKKYGDEFRAFLKRCGICEVRTAYKSPWQNPYVERFIGTLRRDLLDHVIIINEGHLHDLLKEYINEYYHIARPHQGLGGKTPSKNKFSMSAGNQKSKLIAFPVCGGLHHRYKRAA